MTAPSAGATATLPRDSRIQLAFAVIYVVWGVTPAVNRIMVLQLPPLLAAGARFALAGAFLTALAHARGLALPKRAEEWRSLAVSAVLGIVISNGLSVMALQHIASNQAALINSSCAFWLAWIGMYGRRAAPVSNRTWAGLAVGFAGVAVLLSARGLGAEAHLGWQLAILGSALAWALATAVIREAHSASDPLAFTACYLLCGGVLLVTLGLAAGEASRWSWSPPGLGAIAFLALFSSTFGFVAYTFLLMHETPSRIGTYAYVNPPVAVISGWLLLGERLDAVQLTGSAIVLVGVALVRNLRLWPRRRGARGQPR